jgi:hypothetical protein
VSEDVRSGRERDGHRADLSLGDDDPHDGARATTGEAGGTVTAIELPPDWGVPAEQHADIEGRGTVRRGAGGGAGIDPQLGPCVYSSNPAASSPAADEDAIPATASAHASTVTPATSASPILPTDRRGAV